MLRRLLIAATLALAPSLALAQGTVLQGGPWTPGHAPMYVGQGSSQPVVQDSGPAGGGGIGLGLSEFNVTARGTGTAPYSGQGTGPYGTTNCTQDAPTTNPTGYHYFCFSPNGTGGTAVMAVGNAGTAAPLPFTFYFNGTAYTFPFTAGGGVVGPATSVVNDIAVWNNTAGTLLKDVPFVTLCGNNLFSSSLNGCAPSSGGGTANFLRADGTWTPVAVGPGSTTATAIALWNNTTGTSLANSVITVGSTGKMFIPDDNTVTTSMVQVGTGGTNNSLRSALQVLRSLTGTELSIHAFSDNTTFNIGGPNGANSFDSRTNHIGTQNYDHFNSFQSLLNYASSGTMTVHEGFDWAPTVTNGTVTTAYGILMHSPSVSGSGSIGTVYGLFVSTLGQGTSGADRAVFTQGSTASEFGGYVISDTGFIARNANPTFLFQTAGAVTEGSVTHNGTNMSIINSVNGGALVLAGNNSATAAIIGAGFVIGNTGSDPGLGGILANGATIKFPGLANAAANEIVCFASATGLLTYEPSVATCVPSALRLKNPVAAIDPALALDGISSLLPAIYTYKDTAEYGPNEHAGLYADHVCAMDERLCIRDAEGRVKNYDKTGLLAYLVGAIQELRRAH